MLSTLKGLLTEERKIISASTLTTKNPIEQEQDSIEKPGLVSLVQKKSRYTQTGEQDSQLYQKPEYDFEKVYRVFENESIASISRQKVVERVHNSGWKLSGKNVRALRWVRLRLKEIEERSGQPMDTMFHDMLRDLVTYNNVIVYKNRKRELVSGQMVPIENRSRQLPPLVSLEVLDVLNLNVAISKRTNRVSRWKLYPPWNITNNGEFYFSNLIFASANHNETDIRYFNPEEILHISSDRHPGKVFGQPWVAPVIPDMVELRRLEELAGLIAFQRANPLIHVQVGGKDKNTVPKIDPATGRSPQIDQVAEAMELMPTEGYVTTSSLVGMTRLLDGQDPGALDSLLSYYISRVHEGLYLSSIDAGNNSGTSRASAFALTKEGVSRAKFYALWFGAYITLYVVNDILREGGFDPMVEENQVQFLYNEIDIETLVKMQQHVVSLFTQNAITHEELRERLGLDPLSDNEEVRLFFEMISKNLAAHKAELDTETADSEATQSVTGENQHGKNRVGSPPKD